MGNTMVPQSPEESPTSLEIPLQEKRLINREQLWAETRFRMEMEDLKTNRFGKKEGHHWFQLLSLLKIFSFFLNAFGLYRKGLANAEKIFLKQNNFYFKNLPSSFNGFKLLHLSDLHLDGMPGIEDRIINLLKKHTVDLCVLTGDYRMDLHGPYKHVINKMEHLIKNINSRLGFVGVLGNHDGCHMLGPLENIGIKMLTNSSLIVHQGEEKIRFIGTDDVHYYYTDMAMHALEHAEGDFSIALVHSPELFDYAALMEVDLYLCGHTHGGQICLPNGQAIFKHLERGRKYYRGPWTHGNMQGYTSTGAGTSGIPIRFFSQGEVSIHTLLCSPSPQGRHYATGTLGE